MSALSALLTVVAFVAAVVVGIVLIYSTVAGLLARRDGEKATRTVDRITDRIENTLGAILTATRLTFVSAFSVGIMLAAEIGQFAADVGGMVPPLGLSTVAVGGLGWGALTGTIPITPQGFLVAGIAIVLVAGAWRAA